jgi:hypothetical protein
LRVIDKPSGVSREDFSEKPILKGGAMIAVVRVRFKGSGSSTTYWPDQLVNNWMQPLRANSIANFWWLSSRGLFDLNYLLFPEVSVDSKAPATTAERDPLEGAVIDAVTKAHNPDWSFVDILMCLFEDASGWWGGGTKEAPLPGGGTKPIRLTVIDFNTPFDAACQELGHSFGLDHELRVDSKAAVAKTGDNYASPYSVMSAQFGSTGFNPEYLCPADANLPQGAPSTGATFKGQPVLRISGPLLTGAQMLRHPGFRDSPRVIQLGSEYASQPAKVRLYASNHLQGEGVPSPAPVLVTFPSNRRDGRTYAVELRRGTSYITAALNPAPFDYDYGIGAGMGPPEGLVVHSLNPEGTVRYEGVAAVKLAADMTDWASLAGDFSLRYAYLHPHKEYADIEVHGGGVRSFPIRGVLLAGGFRTQAQLNLMSYDDMRNTLITELTGRTNQNDYQAYENDTLAGVGAALVFLRKIGSRDDAALKSMSADDIRNTLIVEIFAQTNTGDLQAFSNMELVTVALGSKRAVEGKILGAQNFWIQGVLLAGGFRTYRQLIGMSYDDQRNTLIVELTAHSNQTNYQAYDNDTLAAMGAVMVLLRAFGYADDNLKGMSADDQRNTLIVELDSQTKLGQRLQGLSNMELVLTALGVEKPVA